MGKWGAAMDTMEARGARPMHPSRFLQQRKALAKHKKQFNRASRQGRKKKKTGKQGKLYGRQGRMHEKYQAANRSLRDLDSRHAEYVQLLREEHANPHVLRPKTPTNVNKPYQRDGAKTRHAYLHASPIPLQPAALAPVTAFRSGDRGGFVLGGAGGTSLYGDGDGSDI